MALTKHKAKAWWKRGNYSVKGVYNVYTGYGVGSKVSTRGMLKQRFWKEYNSAYGD